MAFRKRRLQRPLRLAIQELAQAPPRHRSRMELNAHTDTRPVPLRGVLWNADANPGPRDRQSATQQFKNNEPKRGNDAPQLRGLPPPRGKKPQEWNRKHEAASKNSKGQWKGTFELGDKVKTFIPPTANETHRRSRKAKNCFWYRGPGVIVKVSRQRRIRPNRKRVAMRTNEPGNAHMAANANTPPPRKSLTISTAPASTKVPSGDVIAIKDDATDNTYWLADVTCVKGDGLSLAYYGTNGHNLRTARFQPLSGTGKNELAFTSEKGPSRGTGQISAHGPPG